MPFFKNFFFQSSAFSSLRTFFSVISSEVHCWMCNLAVKLKNKNSYFLPIFQSSNLQIFSRSSSLRANAKQSIVVRHLNSKPSALSSKPKIAKQFLAVVVCRFHTSSLPYIHTSNKGQTLIEGLIVCMLVTALMFGLIQVCVLVVNDMLYNEVSFSATRAVTVTKEKDIQSFSKKTVNKLLITSGLTSGLLFADIEQDSRDSDEEKSKTTNWEGTILGENIVDHNGTNIKKYNVKVTYKTRLMFYKLFGGNLFREQSARTRMIKSPDVKYYDKAYPDAKNFSDKK